MTTPAVAHKVRHIDALVQTSHGVNVMFYRQIGWLIV